MKATRDLGLRTTQCLRWLRSLALPAPADTRPAASKPVAASLRPSLLALLAVLPLALSTHVMAGAPFGPATADTSMDLSAAGAKFPKRDNETREGEILVKFKAGVPPATRDANHVGKGNL